MLSFKWPPWTCSPSRTLDEVSRIYFCTYDMISSKMSLIKVQIKRFDLSVILEIISYSHDTWQDCDLLSLVGQQGWGIWCVFGNSDILQVTFYRNFSDFHVIQFAWFRMEDRLLGGRLTFENINKRWGNNTFTLWYDFNFVQETNCSVAMPISLNLAHL